MEGNGNKAEAERWLGTADKLLMVRDLIGSRKFAIRAHESYPLLAGVDQILAVSDVLLAAEKRINNHLDWYAILQIDRRSNDLPLIKRQYLKLASLLHPENNKSFFADNAFKLVSDAWTVLSDPSKKSLYDNELNLFSKIDFMASNNENLPQIQQQQQQTPRRSPRDKKKKVQARGDSGHEKPSLLSTFWTACPYCYNMYEFPRVYEECCLRCQNCQRAFHAAVILSPPPVVPGKEAYFCCWGFFPLGFSMANSGLGAGGSKNNGFSNWTPFSPLFPCSSRPEEKRKAQETPSDISGEGDLSAEMRGSRKKGRTENGKERTLLRKQSVEASNVVKPQMMKKDKVVSKKSIRQAALRSQNKGLERESATQDLGKQDLNLEAQNDVEEPAPGPATGDTIETESREEDVTEGIAFFEGLDDFLGSLPIFSIVEDERQKDP